MPPGRRREPVVEVPPGGSLPDRAADLTVDGLWNFYRTLEWECDAAGLTSTEIAKLFDYEGVKVVFTDGAARAIAHEALNRKVGARGLRMILEELMLDVMYHIPGNKKIKELLVTEEMVKARDITLPIILEKAG